jgi:predicted transcriptional regulator
MELVQRHLEVLKLVMANEPIGIIKLSELSGMPQHKVRYSLRVWEHHGIIRPSPQGAISTEKAREFLKSFPNELRKISEEIKQLAEID